MQNPFKYGGIVSGPYFADRTEEIKELNREMGNNSRIFLVSPRRYGKTCLPHNLMSALAHNDTPCASIDLNALIEGMAHAERLASNRIHPTMKCFGKQPRRRNGCC